MILIFALRSRENDSHFHFTIGCKNVHVERFALSLAVRHFLGSRKFSARDCVVGYGQLSN